MTVEYLPVAHHHESVIIVGNAPSARPLTTLACPEASAVIAVNGAVEWLPRADYWFTLDPDTRNRRRMREQRPGTYYYAAVPPEFGQRDARLPVWRMPPEPRVHWLRRRIGSGPLSSRRGLSVDPAAVNTGNSAYGALGLALHMGARRVALFGVQADGDGRITGGRPGDLAHLPELFASALPQLHIRGIDVVIAGKSRIDGFPRMGVEEALRWVAG
jgi:hypothetical protein